MMMKSNFGQIKDIYDVLWVYNDGLYELGVCHYRSIVKVVIISSYLSIFLELEGEGEDFSLFYVQ